MLFTFCGASLPLTSGVWVGTVGFTGLPMPGMWDVGGGVWYGFVGRQDAPYGIMISLSRQSIPVSIERL